MSKDNTARYRLLVAYYLGEARFDQTRAAELAGYQSKTRDGLRVLACQLFQRPDVRALIEQKVRKMEITQEELIEELTDMARFDWRTEYTLVGDSMVNAKKFDTAMRAKMKAIADLLKHTGNDNRKQIDSIKAAISEWMEQTKSSVKDAQEAFASSVPKEIMDEVVRELLAASNEKAEIVQNTQTDSIQT